MTRKIPLTLSSWTIGDKVKFEDRVIYAKKLVAKK